jgi:hypothetical protein
MDPQRLIKTRHWRCLAALIAAAVLLSVCVPSADAAPVHGRQPPPIDGDIDDCPFSPDPGTEEISVAGGDCLQQEPEGVSAPDQTGPLFEQAAAGPKAIAVC